jgi:hypothetical protein
MIARLTNVILFVYLSIICLSVSVSRLQERERERDRQRGPTSVFADPQCCSFLHMFKSQYNQLAGNRYRHFQPTLCDNQFECNFKWWSDCERCRRLMITYQPTSTLTLTARWSLSMTFLQAKRTGPEHAEIKRMKLGMRGGETVGEVGVRE